MPKRRTYNFKRLQSSSSSASRQDGAGNSDSPVSASVNELLSELRKVETPESLQKKRDLTASVNEPSVPPGLRGILGVPESAPPKPKLGVRLREMRTPGPAPPKSWLGYQLEWQSTLVVRGGKGWRKRRAFVRDVERNRPKQLMRFDLLLDGKLDQDAEQPSGLLHLALKRLAEQWDLFDEEDFPALAEVPLRLRLRLLSYLGRYGPPLDVSALQALTQGDDQLTRLDLAGLAGHNPLTVKRLTKSFEAMKPTSTANVADEVAESWDAEDTLEYALTQSPRVSRFNGLTHLCLSSPPSTASWRDLLTFSKHVPRLTHLSLAFWPRPTLTPNLATATVSSRHSPDVRAGGSHYYSALDQNYVEAAALLRQLSNSLLCLQWLDLEGCAEWVPALGTLAAGTSVGEATNTRGDEAGWASTTPTAITIFAHTWKNLMYIRCAQGWLPTLAGTDAVDRSLAPEFRSLLNSQAQRFPVALLVDQYEVDKRKANIWLDNEQRLLATGRRINNIRRARSCKPVTMDFGWIQRAI